MGRHGSELMAVVIVGCHERYGSDSIVVIGPIRFNDPDDPDVDPGAVAECTKNAPVGLRCDLPAGHTSRCVGFLQPDDKSRNPLRIWDGDLFDFTRRSA